SLLGLGNLEHVRDDKGALLLGLLAEPRRLLPGLGELLAVALEYLLGFGLSLLRAAQATLDRICPGGQRLLDARQQHLPQHREHDEEGDEPDDQLGPFGDQRVSWWDHHRCLSV